MDLSNKRLFVLSIQWLFMKNQNIFQAFKRPFPVLQLLMSDEKDTEYNM